MFGLFVGYFLMQNVVCFHQPLPYVVHMHNHQGLTFSGDTHSKEAILLVETSNEQETLLKKINLNKNKKNNLRIKRQKDVKYDSEYDDGTQQYHGSLETPSNMTSKESFEYDYEKFKDEYYHDLSKQTIITASTIQYEEYDDDLQTTKATTQKSKKQKRVNVTMENYCNVLLLFRFRVFECFWYGLRNWHEEIITKAGYVIAFWLVLYMIIAVYFWCTRGWCCCCCMCKFCRPRKVVQDAREFLIQNPPGMLKLEDEKQIVTYRATDHEQLCHSDLERAVFNF